MFVIFDLDDTLTDTRHRAHLAPSDWQGFYDACIDDPPLWSTLKIFELLHRTGHRVEIRTGRSETVRGLTEQWFLKHVRFIPEMKMRPAGFRGRNEILKREWLQEDIKNQFLPNLVFEDREDIAEMYRSYDIRVALVDTPSAEAAEKVDKEFPK